MGDSDLNKEAESQREDFPAPRAESRCPRTGSARRSRSRPGDISPRMSMFITLEGSELSERRKPLRPDALGWLLPVALVRLDTGGGSCRSHAVASS